MCFNFQFEFILGNLFSTKGEILYNKPGFHHTPTLDDSLSVVIRGDLENLQRIVLMNQKIYKGFH